MRTAHGITILCTISLALSYVSHLLVLIFVQYQTISYIYILNVAALDETIIPNCLHFSVQNIEQSRGLGRASR